MTLILQCELFLTIKLWGYLEVSPCAHSVEAGNAAYNLKLAKVVSFHQDTKRVPVRLTDNKLTLHYEQNTMHIRACLYKIFIWRVESCEEWSHQIIDEMAMQLAEEQTEFAFEGTKKFDHYFWFKLRGNIIVKTEFLVDYIEILQKSVLKILFNRQKLARIHAFIQVGFFDFLHPQIVGPKPFLTHLFIAEQAHNKLLHQHAEYRKHDEPS